jgi:hypothetical protein
MTNQVTIAPVNIGDITEQYPNLDYKQIRSLNYFANGLSVHQVAKLVNTKASTIKEWLVKDDYREALGLVQRRAATWSYETQKNLLFLANDKIEHILLQDYDTAAEQERREIARTARYIRDEARANEELGIVPTGQAYIEDESTMMIAKHIKELNENKTNDIVPEYDIFAAPATQVIHIDTTYGVLNHNEEDNTYQCHICGNWFGDVYAHAKRVHRGLSRIEYNAIARIVDSE